MITGIVKIFLTTTITTTKYVYAIVVVIVVFLDKMHLFEFQALSLEEMYALEGGKTEAKDIVEKINPLNVFEFIYEGK